MGANHARVLAANPAVALTCIVDPADERGRAAAAATGSEWFRDHRDLVGRVDAAVVAVPTHLHREIALALLEQGIPVLVEKPIASTVAEGEELVEAARRAGVVLAVGHVERYNPAVLELDGIVTDPIHLEFRRLSPFTPRIEEGVVRDLMIHDLDLAIALAGGDIVDVAAVAVRNRSAGDDLASALLTFDNGVVATLTASRVGQEKIRHVDITQRDNVVHVDLIRQDITIHRAVSSEFVTTEGARYTQAGVVEIPYLRHRGEPLALELADFVRSVTSGGSPRVTGEVGLLALAAAERVERAARRAALA